MLGSNEKFPIVFGSHLPGQIVFYLLSSMLALMFAMLSWHLYEKHFLKLKIFFPVERVETFGEDLAPVSPSTAFSNKLG